MKNYFPIVIISLFLLAACETNKQDADAIKAQAKEDIAIVESNAKRHGERVANNLRDQVKITSMKLREWLLTPPTELPPTALPSSYCYQVFQDIICYRAPMIGMEHKLVGYQGDMAAEPAIAQTKSLPKSAMKRQTSSEAMADKVKSSKPVFDAIPAVAKDDKKSTTIEGAEQIGSEPLPDPNLSPQL